MKFGVALTIRLSQKYLQIKQNMHHLFWNLKNALPIFYLLLHFEDYKVLLPVITILFVSVYFLRYFITLTKFCSRLTRLIFFSLTATLGIPNCVTGCRHPFLFNWATGKTKTPILLYIMQHPRYIFYFWH